MANKTIPALNEIELADLTVDQLMVLDSGLETFKVRMSTVIDFVFDNARKSVDVIYNGTDTGVKTVTVSSYVADARTTQWTLKKPATSPTYGEQIQAVIKTPDIATVLIDTGDFALDAGTYTLLGV